MDYITTAFGTIVSVSQNSRNFLFHSFRDTFSVWKPKTEYHAQHDYIVRESIKKHCYPWDYNDICRYFMPVPTNDSVERDFFFGDIAPHDVPKDEHYQLALDTIVTMFRPPRKIRPVHFADLRLYPWNWHPSAEAPFSDHAKYLRMLESLYQDGTIPDRRSSFGNFKDIIFGVVRQQLHRIKHGLVDPDTYMFYFKAHARAQLSKLDAIDPDTGKPKEKVRLVFGAPKTFILAEAMFFWPLFNYYQTNIGKSPLLWGYETLNGGWLRLNEELNRSLVRGSILMIDWKQFDKHALFTVLDDINDHLRTFFDFNNGYIPTVTAPTHPNLHPDHPLWLDNLWNWTCYAFKAMPTHLPSGRVYTRLHAGIPSGAFTTNYRDSIYNGLMILTCVSSLGLPVDKDIFLKLMGDDSLTRFFVLIPTRQHQDFLDALSEKSDYYFKSAISTTKSKMCNRPYGSEVLSYFNCNGFPTRDYNELLARLLNTKSKKPTPGLTMAAAIGIYYASAGNCTYLREVCLDVFTQLKLQGYTADRSALSGYFDPNVLTNLDIELDYFPSRLDVQQRLTSLSERSKTRSENYWPSWYFQDIA
nr:putative RNA-dependent RNA polymerase [Leptosphaeria biglobosa partitivirus 4]